MKTQNSITVAKAIISVILLALGFSRAAAQVDPSTSQHTSQATVQEEVSSPCIFTSDQD